LILRFVAIGLIVLLAACGGQSTTSSVPQPTQPAAPTQPPEATAAPQPTRPPAATVNVIKVTPNATSQIANSLGDVLAILATFRELRVLE